MALYQKYRPKKFADLFGEDHIRDTLLQMAKSNRLSHAFLLCGPRGIGKTTTARLLAKVFNCQGLKDGEPCNECEYCLEADGGRAVDIIEIDAASHTKVDEIREVIDKAQVVPSKSKKKVYIIDEVHMLSTSSFNALLKTLEEPPAHAIFILATTEVHKIPATILSRVQRFDFQRVSTGAITKNLSQIAQEEKIEIEPEALEIIALSAEGGHRDAIGLLEQVSSIERKITKQDVIDILGISLSDNVISFLRAIFNGSPEEGLKIAQGQYSNGKSIPAFQKSVLEYLRKVLIFKATGKVLFEDTKENIEAISQLSKSVELASVLKTIEIFIGAGQLVKESANPILPIEMAIVRASALFQSKPEQRPKAETMAVVENKAKQEVESKPEVKKPVPANEIKAFVPVEVIQMTGDLWEKVIAATKKENATLAALLKDAKPLEVKDGLIKLGVKFAFHKDKISEIKNCTLLEKIAENILGQKCKIVCELNDFKTRVKSEAINKEELEKVATEVFS